MRGGGAEKSRDQLDQSTAAFLWSFLQRQGNDGKRRARVCVCVCVWNSIRSSGAVYSMISTTTTTTKKGTNMKKISMKRADHQHKMKDGREHIR